MYAGQFTPSERIIAVQSMNVSVEPTTGNRAEENRFDFDYNSLGHSLRLRRVPEIVSSRGGPADSFGWVAERQYVSHHASSIKLKLSHGPRVREITSCASGTQPFRSRHPAEVQGECVPKLERWHEDG